MDRFFKFITICVWLLVLICACVSAWQFTYNWADYQRDATLFTKQTVYKSAEFQNLTQTNCISNNIVVKYVSVSFIENDIASGDFVLQVDGKRQYREYEFNLSSESIIYYNSTAFDLSDYCKESLMGNIIVEMDYETYKRFLKFMASGECHEQKGD